MAPPRAVVSEASHYGSGVTTCGAPCQGWHVAYVYWGLSIRSLGMFTWALDAPSVRPTERSIGVRQSAALDMPRAPYAGFRRRDLTARPVVQVRRTGLARVTSGAWPAMPGRGTGVPCPGCVSDSIGSGGRGDSWLTGRRRTGRGAGSSLLTLYLLGTSNHLIS